MDDGIRTLDLLRLRSIFEIDDVEGAAALFHGSEENLLASAVQGCERRPAEHPSGSTKVLRHGFVENGLRFGLLAAELTCPGILIARLIAGEQQGAVGHPEGKRHADLPPLACNVQRPITQFQQVAVHINVSAADLCALPRHVWVEPLLPRDT